MSRSEIIAELEAEYVQRRRRNEAERERRIAEISALDATVPELLAVDLELLRAHIRAIIEREAYSEAQAERTRAAAGDKRRKLCDRLTVLGFPIDYLEPIHNCSACGDSGYVDDGLKTRCHCFTDALNERMNRGVDLSGANGQTFELFDAHVFPGDTTPEQPVSQRARMIAARDICQRYADAYPACEKINLVLMGASGLGKTFLLNCIAARALARGFDVLRMTAFQMFADMRNCHMGDEDGREGFEEMLSCSLLLLDDIGTEPLFKNITCEYMFTLLNERLTRRKHTVIATNLTMGDVRERYGERVFSRMMADRDSAVLRLVGRDIRLERGVQP